VCCRVAQLVCAHACIRWGLKIEFWKKTHTYFLPFYHLEQAMIGKPRTATFAVMRVYIPAVKAYYGIVIAQLFFLTQKLVKLTFCFTLSVHETWTQKELRCTYPNRPEPGGILKRPEIYIGWPSWRTMHF